MIAFTCCFICGLPQPNDLSHLIEQVINAESTGLAPAEPSKLKNLDFPQIQLQCIDCLHTKKVLSILHLGYMFTVSKLTLPQ